MRLLTWLPPAVLAAALAPAAGGDTPLFRAAGKTLLSAHWAATYADPQVQAGPLQLALYGALGSPLARVVAVAVAVLVVVAMRAAGIDRPLLLAGVGLAAVVGDLAWSGVDSGHPANAVLPLLWVLAAVLARRDRLVPAALLVAAGAGLETWGVLGVAVLALAPPRAALRGAAVAAVAAASLFLPFVVKGQFEMGRYTWVVGPHAPIAFLLGSGASFGWALRIAQGALAIAAGVWVARASRRSVHAVWLVPLAVVLVRLALDPLDSDYYFVGLEGPALVGLAAVAVHGVRLPRLQREPAL